MFSRKVKFEDVAQKMTIPPMPTDYVLKALEKGLGLPPLRPEFLKIDEYGAKCMLIGFKEGKRRNKKKYKKKIRLLQLELQQARKEPLGKLKKICETTDPSGVTFEIELPKPMEIKVGDIFYSEVDEDYIRVTYISRSYHDDSEVFQIHTIDKSGYCEIWDSFNQIYDKYKLVGHNTADTLGRLFIYSEIKE